MAETIIKIEKVPNFISAVAQADKAVIDKEIDEAQAYYRIIGAFYQLLGVVDQEPEDGGGQLDFFDIMDGERS